MSRVIIADASKVSGADFVRALRPQVDPLDVILGKLWTAASAGDREAVAEAHRELAEWKTGKALTEKVESELRFTMRRTS